MANRRFSDPRQSFMQSLAGVVGFEPTVHGTKNRCLTAWLHPNRAAGDSQGGFGSQAKNEADGRAIRGAASVGRRRPARSYHAASCAFRIRPRMSRAAAGMLVPGPKMAETPAAFSCA